MTDRPADARAPSTGAPDPDRAWARYRASGDPVALGAFFDATAPALFRIAVSLVHDATVAEDVLQETYLAALEHADRHDAERPVMPWFVGILRVMVKRSRRDVTRTPDPERLAAVRAATTADDLADEGEDTARIRKAIDALEEPYRSVALLRWRYGLSPAEIADVRAEPPGTARSLLSRALAQLREALRGAPAFFLLPAGPRGLEGVRQAVLAKAATITATSATAAAGVAAVSWIAKLGIAAAIVAAAVGGVVLVRGRDRDGSGTAEPPLSRAPAPAGTPRTSATSPSTSPSMPPPTPPATSPQTPPAVPRDVAPPPAAMDADAPAPAMDDAPTPAVVPEGGAPEVPDPDGLRPRTPPPLPTPEWVPPPPPKAAPVDPTAPPAPAPPMSPPADADEAGVGAALAQRIHRAIDLGVAWLRSQQLADGSWGIVEGNAAYDAAAGSAASGAYGHPAGATSLALYALLKSGVEVDDPAVRKGFAYLRARHRVPDGAYELSALLLAVTATALPPPKGLGPSKGLPPSKDDGASDADDRVRFPTGDWREWTVKLHAALLEKRRKAKTLGWRYMVDGNATVPPGGNEDLSSTQLAALALLACERCGIKTESRVWTDLLAFALKQQEATGPERARVVEVRGGAAVEGPSRPVDRARGFAYIRSDTLDPDEGRATGGMTACGLATIQLARYVLGRRTEKSAIRDPAVVQQAIYDGLAWLDLHWSPFQNPQKTRINVYHVYYLYCTERAFDLLGNLRLGKHFWYPEMAEQLLARQAEKGFWDSASTHKPRGVLDTSFALLFLARSTHGVIPYPSLTEPGDGPGSDRR